MLKKVKKTWGEEHWYVNNELYCSKLLIVNQNQWSSKGKYHYHKKKDETFYILNGTLLLDLEGSIIPLKKGESIRIKPNEKHKFTSKTKTCKFLEVSTHHEDSDSFRVKK